MDLLTYDRDINQDVLEAIQTILNIFSSKLHIFSGTICVS